MERDNQPSPWRDVVSWLILAFRPPDAEAHRQLSVVDPADLVNQLGWKHVTLSPEQPLDGAAPPSLEAIQTEYVRLFVNAPHTPVAYLDAASYLQDEGPEAQAALLAELTSVLNAAGLVAPPTTQLPLDHLATLLEVLYWSDIIEATETRETVLRILHGWVPQMLQRLQLAQPSVWYATAARLLALTLDLDTASNPRLDSENPDGIAARQTKGS